MKPTTSVPARRLRRLGSLIVIGAALIVAACGDDDTTVANAPSASTTSTVVVPESDRPVDILEVVATDYSFGDLPSEIGAGTLLELRNESTSELHELVAFRLADDDDASVADLLQLPPTELFPRLGEPSTVLLLAPGSPDVITAVGDGTLTEPGRYAFICAIPSGADPAAYLAAAAESEGEAPQGVPGGPPHFVNGMFAEVMVTTQG